ncbi:hypothetical protein AN1V17_40740 [Vallitalea sediminicola]
MGQITKKNIHKYILTYITTMVVIYILNILNIKIIKQLPFECNREKIMMLSAIIWFVIISVIYIVSYLTVNKFTNYKNNPFLYFLPYFVINILLAILYYVCIKLRIDNYITYYIDNWFCWTNVVAGLIPSGYGMKILLYQTIVYNIWIILIAFIAKKIKNK